MTDVVDVAAGLPGAEIVRAGLADLEAGRDTANAAAVSMAASRLRDAGIAVPDAPREPPAAHRLYEHLRRADAPGAHSRYNGILRRVLSFARAAEHARGG